MRRLFQKRIRRYWQNCQCKAAFQELGEGRGRGGSGGGQSKGEREGDEIESNWERKEKMQTGKWGKHAINIYNYMYMYYITCYIKSISF